MKVFCPSCRTALEAFETTCPQCMRERTPAELEAAQGDDAMPMGGDAPQKSSLGGILMILIGIGVLGGMGYLYTQGRLGFLNITARDKARDAADNNASAAPKKTGAQALEGAIAAQAAVEVQTPEKSTKWVVGGEVYDLLSLNPVRGAVLVFTDRLKGKRYETKTNSKGRYTIKLPKLKNDGYDLEVRHRSYRKGIYLEEDPARPFKNQDRASRYETHETFRRSIVHAPLTPAEDETLVRHDLAMFPPR